MRLLGRVLAVLGALALGFVAIIGLSALVVAFLVGKALSVSFVAVVGSLVLVGVLCTLGFFVALGARMSAANGGVRGGLSEEETRIVQEIHSGLSRLERRVETLEEILVEPGGAGPAEREVD